MSADINALVVVELERFLRDQICMINGLDVNEQRSEEQWQQLWDQMTIKGYSITINNDLAGPSLVYVLYDPDGNDIAHNSISLMGELKRDGAN